MDPITLSALIGGGFMLANTGLNKMMNPTPKQYPTAPAAPSLGQTFMSQGGTMPSNMNLYPKQSPTTQTNGSLLGNSNYNALAQYLSAGKRPFMV